MRSEKNGKANHKLIKVVLDTNILVSSLLTSGSPAAIVDLIAEGKIIPYFSYPILQEYREVLSRKKFNFNSIEIRRLLDDITRAGIAVEDKPHHKNRKVNEDDRIFYNAAVEAQGYLITGNSRHFPGESFIVSPSQFLAIYGQQE
jgi:putative PIN family toxin of toxin-antitoxin system